jgi:hypothetical protein
VKGFEGFKNCEDFVLSDEPGVAYVGCDPIRTKVNTVMNFNSLAPGEIAPSGAIWKVRYTEVS